MQKGTPQRPFWTAAGLFAALALVIAANMPTPQPVAGISALHVTPVHTSQLTSVQ
eukprot:m.210824 g.210824  ORF g.210824 m.210824 type:complete len:55 (+) comp25294_c0_seq1:360-524(+)